jgi:MFS family permease
MCAEGNALAEPAPEGQVSARAEWLTGWRVVLAAAAGAAAGLILYPFVASLFIKHHTAAFEWTRGEASFASVATLIAGSLAPFVGRLADKIGVRPVIIMGAIGFAASCFGMSVQDGNIWLYYALTFSLVFFGLGTTSITWARPINAVFVRSRGLALSTALSSVTLTAAITPPLLNFVMETYGWRAGWVALGLMAVAGSALGLLLLPKVKPRPEAVINSYRLGEATRMPAFWLLVAGMFIINIPSGGLMAQMAALVGDKGLDGATVASVLSAFAISVFIGRLIAGFCLDRFSPQLVTFIAMGIPAAGCLMLLGQGGYLPLVIAGIALAGLSQGAEGDVGPFLIARYFGLKAFGALMGCVNAAVVTGTGVGGILFAQAHDLTGSYDIALWAGAGCFLAGAMCFAAIGASRRPQAAVETA